MIEEGKRLTVVEEDGMEHDYEIMFTFEKDGKNYVTFFDPEAGVEDIEVLAATYDDKGNLTSIESDEEWDMIEEMVNAFVDEENAEVAENN